MRRGRWIAGVAFLGVLLAGGALGVRALAAHEREADRQVEVARSPLRFELPAGWRQVTRTQDPRQAWVIQAAEQQGYTPEKYVELLRASTRATAEGPAVGGRAQTIDVQDSEYRELPSTTTVEARLRALHEEVVGSRVVHTAVGAAVVTRYRVQLGPETITGDAVYVVVSGEVLGITVGAAQEDAVTPVTDAVLRSLHTG